MNFKNDCIPSEKFFLCLSAALWPAIRAHGYEVSNPTPYVGIISNDKSRICTMDFRCRIVADPNFYNQSLFEYDEHREVLIYLYLKTLLSCLNAMPLSWLGINGNHPVFDLLSELVDEYALEDQEMDEYEDASASAFQSEASGIAFDCITGEKLHHRLRNAVLLAAGMVCASVFLHRRKH